MKRRRRSAGKAWGSGGPGVCVSEGGGDSEGAEARGLSAGSPSSPSGCRGAAALSDSPPAAGSGAPSRRASPAPTEAGRPSQSPTPPAQPREVEGGAVLSASAAPLRPRVFPAPTRGAAPRSGSGGDSAGHSRVPGDRPTAGRERGRGMGLRMVAGTGETNGSVGE